MQSHSRMTLKIFFFLLVIVSVSVSAEMPQPYKSLISKYNFKKDSYSFVVKNLTNPQKKAVIYNGSKNFNPDAVVDHFFNQCQHIGYGQSHLFDG